MRYSRKPISFIATDAPEKARDFFCDVLGLQLLETSPFALVFADGDHVLRVQIVSHLPTAAHTVHGWQIINIVSEIAELMAKGVHFLRFDHLSQDALGVWTSPDGHRIAWFNDPSGNILSLTQCADKQNTLLKVEHAHKQAFAWIEELHDELHLPGVGMGEIMKRPSLKHRGKSIIGSKGHVVLVVSCPLEINEVLLEAEPNIYFETDHYKGYALRINYGIWKPSMNGNLWASKGKTTALGREISF